MQPFNLMGWVEKNKDRLMPPVANETIFKGNDNFIVMVSGGPNSRKDYHYNESEELFLQLKGDIKIKLYW
ncbi:3-hydroxyanthranilate 3,4-dioxygenase, partial [candidate division KSB1 bacterium]|nr:3-hydroxyanthranilate 3,4-dioxygenase [candidate division KSB1 bacterium]NIR70207.1 3-hydroxyanthranilate 3,4-dioxygenase [candidate division KSB1 bacterium]NIS27594.1 3-hydroxyanthranilate 3,4-dioxygenase [candidate division KSB1 bacterium]NIT74446.1 3-hydroxyanthranilate 3,4-dioxygenase [candidate division KSB1 bacterium]NIU28311.1 3-hydroxyanthranilate 3,4-dioxygenase [candidate division KSB1 bacterium]